jgi:hypothetical protein
MTGTDIWTAVRSRPRNRHPAPSRSRRAENAARASALLAVTPKYNPRLGFLFGCTLSNTAGDLLNDISIAPGKARDATDGVNIIPAAALTGRLDANWTVGDAQGGLDTGPAANVTYHVWLISPIPVADALFSGVRHGPYDGQL